MKSCVMKPRRIYSLGSNVYLHVEGDFVYVEKKQA